MFHNLLSIMMSKPIHELTLKELSAAVQEKQLSPVEITEAYLARMKKYNEELNAYTHIDEEISLQQAKAAEETIMQGKGHMLTGIPLGHKDIFTTKSGDSLSVDSPRPISCSVNSLFNPDLVKGLTFVSSSPTTFTLKVL